MWPLVPLFGIAFPSYHLSLAVGLFVSLLTLFLAARRKRVSLSFAADHALWLVVVSLIAARLVEVVLRGYPLLSFPFFWQDTGFHFFGGLLGGLAALFVVCRLRRERLLVWLDIFSLVGAMGLIFHHLGTFAIGLAYGRPTNLPWGVIYTDPDAAILTTLPVHPTQLYAAIAAFFIFISGSIVFKKTHAIGMTSAFVMGSLAVTSFVIDFLRNDSAPAWGVLRESQYFAIGIALFAAIVYIRAHHAVRPEKDELALAQSPQPPLV